MYGAAVRMVQVLESEASATASPFHESPSEPEAAAVKLVSLRPEMTSVSPAAKFDVTVMVATSAATERAPTFAAAVPLFVKVVTDASKSAAAASPAGNTSRMPDAAVMVATLPSAMDRVGIGVDGSPTTKEASALEDRVGVALGAGSATNTTCAVAIEAVPKLSEPPVPSQ